jgi:hypothetical protein
LDQDQKPPENRGNLTQLPRQGPAGLGLLALAFANETATTKTAGHRRRHGSGTRHGVGGVLPGGEFGVEAVDIGDAPVEALAGEG